MLPKKEEFPHHRVVSEITESTVAIDGRGVRRPPKHADGVGEFLLLGQHRMDGAPGQLAMTDFARAGRAQRPVSPTL